MSNPHPTTAFTREDLFDWPELRPSDATNLADFRVPCDCAGEDDDCRHCRGRGTRSADTGREHLSHSSLSTLLNCEQRYAFEKVHELELITAPKPLDMGRAFQKAIELGDPKAAADMLARSRRMALSQAEEDALRIDMAIVMCAAGSYLSRWSHGWTADRSAEFEYRVRLRNPQTGRYSNTFDLLGYADEVVDLGDTWELIENKLVGNITNVSVSRLPLDRQLALACYGIWRATGKPVSRVQYRFTRKPSIKQKQGESVEQFIARMDADYVTRRDDFYLHEETLYRSTEDLVRIEAELWRWAEQLRAARREGTWARNSSHCSDFGGCAFIPLCVGDVDAPALYRRRETTTETEVAIS